MTKMIITKNDILSEEDRLLIVKDIQYELKHHPTPNKMKPLYQTMIFTSKFFTENHCFSFNFQPENGSQNHVFSSSCEKS